jgi:hypothetical protein
LTALCLELLWQGNVNFYIVRTHYKRQLNKQNKFRADVVPLNKLKQETSFLVNFTIPMHDLLDLKEFQNLQNKQYLLSFINTYLMNKTI